MALTHKKTILLLTTLTLILSASGFRFFPFIVYHLCMINGLSHDALHLQCSHVSRGRLADPEPAANVGNADNGDPIFLPVHGSYNWSFHPVVDKIKMYFCDAQWGVRGGRGGFLSFQAFADDEMFVDDDCGGRHCIWMYNETGIFMFNIKAQRYNYMYEWKPVP